MTTDARERLDWATWMARKGFVIFELTPDSKRPKDGHSWYTRNTRDPAVIEEWFAATPSMNYAAHPNSEHVVIDLDRKPAANGVAAFEEICRQNGIENFLMELDTLIVETPSGGYHLYFKSPFPCANKNDFPAGIDVRGAVGYVVGPGCAIEATGEWTVLDTEAEIAPLPEWLVKFVEEPGRKDPRREEPVVEWDLESNLAQARAWLQEQPPAVQGDNGDDHMYYTVCALRDFAVSEGEIFRLLNEGDEDSWNARCDPPWPDNELEIKIENSFEYASNRPGVKSVVYKTERLASVRESMRAMANLTDEQREELNRIGTITVGNLALVIGGGDGGGVSDDEVPDDERPRIFLSQPKLIENLEELNNAVVRADLNLFERGGSVVSLNRLTETEVKDGIRRPVGSYVIGSVNQQVMQYFAMQSAEFLKWNERKKDFVLTECPVKLVDGYLKNHHVRDLRPLHGIAQAPTLRPDGSVLQENGYDRNSAMFVELRGTFPKVPENPTREQAQKALDKLRHVVRGIMFDGKKNRDDKTPTDAESVWLAAVLTSVVRGAIPTAPLFGFSAPTKGSGKTLAADLVGIISTGNDVPAMSIPDSEEEIRKSLFASLLAGDELVLLDNVKAGVPLRSDALNAILTKSSYQGRVLGASTILTVPVATTFLATGNNFAVDEDLRRRTLLCFIDPRIENPDQRRYDWDARVETRGNRSDLVAAALTIIRAFLTAEAADDPSACLELVPYGSFEDWDRLVRYPLVWVGMPDPANTRNMVMAGSDTERLERGVVETWADLFGNSWMRVRDVVTACNQHYTDEEAERKEKALALREVLEEICADPKGGISNRALGTWLRDRNRRVVAGRRVENLEGRVPKWRMADMARQDK